MTKVFVYGTLCTSFHNWALYMQPGLKTNQIQALGEATTSKAYPLIVTGDRNVPAMFNTLNTDLGLCINGEVYEVNDDCIEALDIIEGTSTGFYFRGKISVHPLSDSGATWECDTYFKGNGESFDFNDKDAGNCLSEREQINEWIGSDKGPSFLNRYSKELHESYFIREFLPKVTALASKRSIEDVMAVYNDPKLQARLKVAASKGEETKILGEIWPKLV